jgi:hypothetical protein
MAALPLSLSEQLDAMLLLGWLERRVALVEGPARTVEGFAAIVAMSRR